jgi:hypothetical protein
MTRDMHTAKTQPIPSQLLRQEVHVLNKIYAKLDQRLGITFGRVGGGFKFRFGEWALSLMFNTCWKGE